jgi:hypothetical protein
LQQVSDTRWPTLSKSDASQWRAAGDRLARQTHSMRVQRTSRAPVMKEIIKARTSDGRGRHGVEAIAVTDETPWL